jgi:hypothetical protein
VDLLSKNTRILNVLLVYGGIRIDWIGLVWPFIDICFKICNFHSDYLIET